MFCRSWDYCLAYFFFVVLQTLQSSGKKKGNQINVAQRNKVGYHCQERTKKQKTIGESETETQEAVMKQEADQTYRRNMARWKTSRLTGEQKEGSGDDIVGKTQGQDAVVNEHGCILYCNHLCHLFWLLCLIFDVFVGCVCLVFLLVSLLLILLRHSSLSFDFWLFFLWCCSLSSFLRFMFFQPSPCSSSFSSSVFSSPQGPKCAWKGTPMKQQLCVFLPSGNFAKMSSARNYY